MIKLLQGDCREVLATLEAESVQTVVTSPPYFGLRDYGTATWEGGDTECDHLRPAAHGYDPFATSTLGPKRDGISAENSAHADGVKRQQFGRECGKCGAQRIDRQIGLEQSPAEYVAQLVEVFREVRRVLRADGTVWLNLGDSFNAAGRIGHGTRVGYKQGTNRASAEGSDHVRASDAGLKPKDLMMIPARVAIALQEDGWWIRSEIIWSKSAPMPESVRDRPTCAHEKVWLLTKAASYYYDADAVAEPQSANTLEKFAKTGGVQSRGVGAYAAASDRNDGGYKNTSRNINENATRNLRNVWHLNPEPFPGAHFATMPATLAERCIKAGSKPGDTVLDPFAGAGTTLLVSDRLQRHAVGIELNPAYCALIQRRLAADAPLLTEVA